MIYDDAFEIYIVAVEDRHSDIALYPFTNKEKAIEESRRIASNYSQHSGYYEERVYGSTFAITYSCEGDSVSVITAFLDKEI